MKKLIACLLAMSMLLGGMLLAIGAASENEPERLPVSHGPVTKEDLDNGLVAEFRNRGKSKQIGDNLYVQVY